MIILTSYGFRSPVVAEKVREYINPENMNVLVIPFAGFDSEKTAATEIKNGLLPFGFLPENIYVVNETDTGINREINFDMIYVPGGNPFKLLRQAQKCNLHSRVIELVSNGTIYFGVSSGADFACEDIEYLKLVEDCDYNIENYKGLGLLTEKVLCHVDQRDMGTLQRVRDYDDRKTIFLRNDEVLVIR